MKIKIFIETCNSTFALQMANFINNYDSNHITIFLVRENRINKYCAEKYDVNMFFYQEGQLLNAIAKIYDALKNQPVEQIELHASLKISNDIILPFLTAINSKRALVRLHLYEESLEELAAWCELNRLSASEFEKIINFYGKVLAEKLGRKESVLGNYPWNITACYAWHKVINTVYYFQENNKYNKVRSLPGVIVKPVCADKQQDYFSLFNIPPKAFLHLTDVCNKTTALLFLGCSPLYESTKVAHQFRLIEIIKKIKRQNNIDDLLLLLRCKNDHKENDKILSLLCKNVINIPSSVTVNLLKMAGISPTYIAGELSDELLQTPAAQLYFALAGQRDMAISATTIVENCHHAITPERIYHLDELKFFSANRAKKRIFYCTASMGDLVYGLGSLNAIKHCLQEECIIVSHHLYAELANACPVVDEHWDINNLTEENIIEMEIARKEGRFHHQGSWEHITAQKHQTDAYLDDFYGFHNNRNAVVSLEKIDTSKVDLFIDDNNLSNKKIVLLHPNIGAKNRTWTEQGWNQLANYFISDGWAVVLIGSDNNKYQNKTMITIDNPEVINAINAFSILETVYFMRRCQLLVACDSGPVALAGLTDIAICALYSIVPGKYRLPYRRGKIGWNAHGIDVKCHIGHCANLIMDKDFFSKNFHKEWRRPNGEDFSGWCPNDEKYQCMQRYSAKSFWQEINNFLHSERFSGNKIINYPEKKR